MMITLIATMLACAAASTSARPSIAHMRPLPYGRATQMGMGMRRKVAKDGVPPQGPPSTFNRGDGDGEGGDNADMNKLVLASLQQLLQLQQQRVPLDYNIVGIAVTVILSCFASAWAIVSCNSANLKELKNDLKELATQEKNSRRLLQFAISRPQQHTQAIFVDPREVMDAYTLAAWHSRPTRSQPGAEPSDPMIVD
ncbi:hypothetical protein T492DRAFT_903329 [Pavlovales sp. CCMP2436]|nr:hypothetical protein T492DRAFT_903329 [Pavlovales sp. CCMP2436]